MIDFCTHNFIQIKGKKEQRREIKEGERESVREQAVSKNAPEYLLVQLCRPTRFISFRHALSKYLN